MGSWKPENNGKTKQNAKDPVPTEITHQEDIMKNADLQDSPTRTSSFWYVLINMGF
jgi:hypothetical protein